MKQVILFFLFLLISLGGHAQNAALSGRLLDASGAAVGYANVALFGSGDSILQKVEASDEGGQFRFRELKAGRYFLLASYVGLADVRREGIMLAEGQSLELGDLSFVPAATELAEVSITGRRAMVEIKPDRTVFNVEGTINSTGSDALTLLRKAPAVTVDNNDNINLLGRAGVLLYVDGKRLPLTGQDLSTYLQNLPADQIDRFDIITSPGAKYEAEGNAGIIDIRLKRDKNLGANGSLNASASQGQLFRANIGGSGNYRNKRFNAFANAGLGDGKGFNNMVFDSRQNGLFLGETLYSENDWQNGNLRFGTDFFLGKKHTLGFLLSANRNEGENTTLNRITIGPDTNPPTVDSILVANTTGERSGKQRTYNLNYRFEMAEGRSLNLDLDYGAYRNRNERYQPNQYYNAEEDVVLTSLVNRFNTPTDIDIYTAKADYEQNFLGGKLSLGSKLSRVVSDNTFLVYDVENGASIQDDTLSNRFEYEENVYAGYLNFARQLGPKWNLNAGLRAEQTDANGTLTAFLPALQEPPVELNYLSWFPSAGLTYQLAEMHALALNYGRRINRPDYNVLNPFNNRLSQISYEKGNPRLQPEIVNNLELGYTLAYRYNFKIAYSQTENQITRLIGPDTSDVRANYISWDNLATQTTWNASISAPVDIAKWWNAYINLSASHLHNEADYRNSLGNQATIDLKAYTYSIYMQHTFQLPAGLKGEISGWYGGPGIWGGVFLYNPSYSLDLGLQRKFLQERLNVRLSASDIFYQSWWDGISRFNGLESEGSGKNDSRRVSLSLNYSFGNQNVKSRNRQTGLEEEAGRVKD